MKTSLVAEAAARFSAARTSEIYEKIEKAASRLSGHRRLRRGPVGGSVSQLLAAAPMFLRRESVRLSRNLKPEIRISLARNQMYVYAFSKINNSFVLLHCRTK